MRALLLFLMVLIAPARAQEPPSSCDDCPTWNLPQASFRIYGNTYYVGTHGLILVTSPTGHVLIDGALPESVRQIAHSIRTLGFRPEDVKLILNSHPHFDHAGGIAELQRLTGATVTASVTAVSADGFLFSRRAACNILLTPHPEASSLWQRLERRTQLAARLERERNGTRPSP